MAKAPELRGAQWLRLRSRVRDCVRCSLFCTDGVVGAGPWAARSWHAWPAAAARRPGSPAPAGGRAASAAPAPARRERRPDHRPQPAAPPGCCAGRPGQVLLGQSLEERASPGLLAQLHRHDAERKAQAQIVGVFFSAASTWATASPRRCASHNRWASASSSARTGTVPASISKASRARKGVGTSVSWGRGAGVAPLYWISFYGPRLRGFRFWGLRPRISPLAMSPACLQLAEPSRRRFFNPSCPARSACTSVG